MASAAARRPRTFRRRRKTKPLSLHPEERKISSSFETPAYSARPQDEEILCVLKDEGVNRRHAYFAGVLSHSVLPSSVPATEYMICALRVFWKSSSVCPRIAA